MTLVPFTFIFTLVCTVLISLPAIEMQTLSYLTFGLTLLGFVIFASLYVYKAEMTRYGLLYVTYMSILIALSFINGVDLKSAIYLAIEMWFILILFRYYRNRVKVIVVSFAIAMSFCVYMNLIHMLMNPGLWMSEESSEATKFLLGGNYNQFGCRMMPALISSNLCLLYSRKWSINCILLASVSIASLAMVGSKTSLTCILLYSIFCIIPSLKIKKLMVISYLGAILFFQIFIVFSGKGLENNEFARYIIEDVLEKDITFTGRTGLWDAAMRVVGDSPLWGEGFVDLDWYLSNMSSFASGPHNLVLSILINGGLLLLAIYIAIIITAYMKIHNFKNHTSLTLIFGLLTMMFIGLMEMYSILFILYVVTLMYYYPQINMTTKQKN